MRAIQFGIGVTWDHKIFQFVTNLANQAIRQLNTAPLVTLEGLNGSICCFAILRRKSAKICLRVREPDAVLKRAAPGSRAIGSSKKCAVSWNKKIIAEFVFSFFSVLMNRFIIERNTNNLH